MYPIINAKDVKEDGYKRNPSIIEDCQKVSYFLDEKVSWKNLSNKITGNG